MAGVAGQGSPKDIKAQSQDFDYDTWAAGAMKSASELPQVDPATIQAPTPVAQAPSAEFDYDKWAMEQVAAPAAQALVAEPDSFGRRVGEFVDQSFPIQVAKGIPGVVSKAAEIVDRATVAPVRGMVDAMADGRNPIAGAAQGVMGNAPSMSEVVGKVLPGSKDNISVPVMTEQTYANQQMGDYSSPVEYTKATLPVSSADALGLAADVYVGNAVIKGLSKIPALTKLGVSALGDYFDAKKASDLVRANSTVLSPTRQAELATSSIQKTAEELQKINSSLKFTPNAVNLTSAEEMEIAKSLANNATFQAVQVKQGEDIVDAMLKHSDAFANIQPKAGGVDKVFDTVSSAADAEGRLLGKFRSQAQTLAGDGQLPIKSLKSKVDELMNKAGFGTNGSDLRRPAIEDAAVKLNMSQDEVKNFLPKLESYYTKLYNGNSRLTYEELNQLYKNDIGIASRSAQKGSYPLQGAFNDLRKAAGEDLRNLTQTILQDSNPAIAAEYKAANDNFSSIMKSYDNIPGILNRDDMSGDQLVKYLMSGQANVDKFSAVRNVLQKQNPELVRDLNGAFINRVFFDNAQVPTASAPLKYDFAGIRKDLKKFAGSDGKMLDIMTGSPEKSKEMMQFVDMMDSIGKSTVANKPIIQETALARGLYLASKVGAPKELISEGILMASRDKNLMRYLDAAGIERMAAKVPAKDRSQYSNYLRSVVNFTQDKAEERLSNEVHR